MNYKGYFIDIVPNFGGYTPSIVAPDGQVWETSLFPTYEEALTGAKETVNFLTNTQNVDDVIRRADELTNFGENEP